MKLFFPSGTIGLTRCYKAAGCLHFITRNSPGDEIANVNFLYDDIVHALNKIQ